MNGFTRALARHRRTLTVITMAAVVGSVTLAVLQPANAATIDTSAHYQIVARHSGKALDIAAASTADGAGLVQQPTGAATSQQFQFVDSGGGFYRLRARHSNKVLDVSGRSTANGANVVQWADLNGTNQQWSVVDTDSGYVQLINRNSAKALDVWEASTADGARVSQFTDTNGNNQQFALVRLGGTPTTPPTTTAPPNTHTFANPIKATRGADPWLQHYNGFYYLATTTWSTNLTMRRSTTLAGLANAAEVQVWANDNANRCCNMWAPEFHLLNGPNGLRWYMYYVAGQNIADYNPTQRLHVLESSGTDPMGPYHYMATFGNTWQLDANILQLGGRLYLLGTFINGTQNLFITPLSNPWTTSGARVQLSTPSLAWERQTAPVQEGPEVLQRNGRTFIVYSASACWGPDYKLGILAYNGSGDPLNPASWTKNPNPVFQRNDANGVFAPGHNGFFKSPDGTEDWIVYHANNSASGGCDNNRTTRAQKFTWNADGTPNFGVPARLGVTLTSPSGELGP